jgi:hypothetical protein
MPPLAEVVQLLHGTTVQLYTSKIIVLTQMLQVQLFSGQLYGAMDLVMQQFLVTLQQVVVMVQDYRTHFRQQQNRNRVLQHNLH